MRSIRSFVLLSLVVASSAAFAQSGARPGTPNLGATAPQGGFLPQAVITQDFTTVATPPNPAVGGVCTTSLAGWFVRNNAAPTGSTCVFNPAAPAPFTAQDGGASSYLAANFNNSTGTNPISTWIVSPRVNFNPGARLSFFFRSANTAAGANFPDRMQARLSTAPDTGTPDVGTAVTDVGTFTTLLVDINPALSTAFVTCPAGGFNFTAANSVVNGTVDGAWCQVTISGAALPTSGSGRIALRYFVQTSGGPSGANSNFIGFDTFSFDEGVAGADLALSQTSTAVSPVSVGSTFNKTLTVTNNGPGAATSFTVVDTLPAQLQHVSNTCGATVTGQTVTWNGGAVPFPGSVSCTITVRVASAGSFSNTANITASAPADPNPANNASTGPVITGASASFATSVPTLGTLALGLLAGLLALVGWTAHRRRTA
jgi:uncharacterized repeat protein (TIGR01451 family)